MAMLIVLVLTVALAAFGFFWHVLWLGVLVGVVALITRLVLIGLDSNRPAGRLNIDLLHSLGRYLLEITDRARHRQRGVQVVEVSKVVDAEPTVADSSAGRPGTMTEQKTEKALAMSEDGMTHAAIADELGVSPSTVGRHLRRRKRSLAKRHTPRAIGPSQR